jgi:beta-glucosidase
MDRASARCGGRRWRRTRCPSRYGQTRQVHFDLTAQQAGYWNSDAQAWTLGAGTYTVRVGDSSRSLQLTGTLAVTYTTGPRYTKRR